MKNLIPDAGLVQAMNEMEAWRFILVSLIAGLWIVSRVVIAWLVRR
ncbi:hypothetical protein [Acetobacter sicerae]|nr:hypothetical protein [Acetobacter sicerae]NHN93457.1 hypothetical protein [Acetobacter sicerae]